MPFLRPTLAQIRKRVASDFAYELGSDAAQISGTVERALVEAVAGASHGLHGHLAWIAINAFAQSAEDEQMEKLAALFGVFRREAVRATGTVAFVRGAFADQVVPKGHRAKVGDVEIEVLEDSAFTNISFFLVVNCRAVVAGEAGNLASGTTLTLMTPIEGVSSNADVHDEFTGGVDRETPLELRTRLLERLAQPPSGGGPGSYIAWAKLVEGVTRVWEFGKIDENGDPKLGWVTVLFMRDNDDPPFPGVDEIAAVKAKIMEFAPLHLAGLHVMAPIELALNMTIELTPNGNPALEAAVEAAIKNKFAAEAVPPDDDNATFYRSKITEAISSVDGVEDYKLTVPSGDITVDQFELLTVGVITWS